MRTLMLATLLALSMPSAAAAQKWIQVSLEGCGCTVMMPARPKITRQTTAGGSHTQQALAIARDRAFLVTHTQFPELNRNRSPDELLMLARDGAAKGAYLLSDRGMTWLGHPAREYMLRFTNNAVALTRILLVGNHFYTINVEGRGERSVSHPDARRFLDSFVLLISSPPAPAAPPSSDLANFANLDPFTVGQFAGLIASIAKHCGGRVSAAAEQHFAKARAANQAEFEQGMQAGTKQFEQMSLGGDTKLACMTAEVSFGPNGLRRGLWER